MAIKIYNNIPADPALEFKKAFKTTGDSWYRVVQKLGEGGSGITYLALGTDGKVNGHLYAVKIFKKIDSIARKRRFLKEVKFLKLNDHPSIMRLVDDGSFCIRDGKGNEFQYPFYLSEYLPVTLLDIMRENTASTVEKASYVVQLLSALDHISTLSAPVVHRDIKPENIFIKGKTCLLGDFGLMTRDTMDQIYDRGVLSDTKKPAVPYFYRTPDLLEFEKSGKHLTPASDIFQLGLVACQLFTGRNPMIRAHNVLDEIKMEPIGQIPGSLGAGISTLLAKMLRINPENRPTAKEILDPWREIFWEAAKMAIDLNGKAL